MNQTTAVIKIMQSIEKELRNSGSRHCLTSPQEEVILKHLNYMYSIGYDERTYNQNLYKCKPVMCIMSDRLVTYPSAKIAAIKTGIHKSNIGMALKGKRKTAGGYKWKYSQDLNR